VGQLPHLINAELNAAEPRFQVFRRAVDQTLQQVTAKAFEGFRIILRQVRQGFMVGVFAKGYVEHGRPP
jgi:hypothetical protein